MLEALALAGLFGSSPQAPKNLADLFRASTHIVVIQVSAFHDLPAQAKGTLLDEVIEAKVIRTLKGPPLGATVFVPFELWWRPDITSARVGDEGIAFLNASSRFPLSRHAMGRLRSLKGTAPAVAAAWGSWGYVPIVSGEAVVSGGVALPLRSRLWTKGGEAGPSVVELEEVIGIIEELASANGAR